LGAEQADRYIDALTRTFVELAQAPRSAPACDHIRPGYRRRVERHIIYFRPTSHGIAVFRILHDRMDAATHLQV
jgi:toxin ParE1/3/4